MTTPPRRFRFSLRTLFVVVTTVTVIALGVARYIYLRYPAGSAALPSNREWALPSGALLGGHDLAEIFNLIRETPELKEDPITNLRVISPTEIEIETAGSDGSGLGRMSWANIKNNGDKWSVATIKTAVE